MNKLKTLLNQLEKKIPEQEFINPLISKSCVGWHIEHTLLTINFIIDVLKRSDPGKYKWEFNSSRILVLTLKKIPRGRAQSPMVVLPKNDLRLTL